MSSCYVFNEKKIRVKRITLEQLELLLYFQFAYSELNLYIFLFSFYYYFLNSTYRHTTAIIQGFLNVQKFR